MKIKAVKFYENGFMTQPFACGLEDGAEKFDANVKYLQVCKISLSTRAKKLFSSIPARPKIFPTKSLTKKLKFISALKLKITLTR